MDIKISVIIPVYNVEVYIEKCIESVLRQTYSNIEVIIIDDGSPDSCGKIIDEYSLKDSRIIVIHKKNGGLSSARNAGLEVSKGDFISFVDSDDWIEPTMYEEMLLLMEKEQCDIVECGVNNASDEKIAHFPSEQNEVLSGKEALRRQLSAKGSEYMPRIAVWSKLFKASFWKNRRFPEGKIHEDYMLTCEALYYAKKVGFIKKGLYNHLLTNNGSIMNSKFGIKDLFLETQYYQRVEFLKEKKEYELAKIAKKDYFLLLLTLYWRCNINGLNEQQYYEKLIKQFKSEINSCELDNRRALEFKIFFLSPCFYMRIRKLLMKIRG